MTTKECRFVEEKLMKSSSTNLLEHERNLVETHISNCSSCQSTWELAHKLRASGRLPYPDTNTPFKDKQIVSAALAGRLPQSHRETKHRKIGFHALAFGVAVVLAIGFSMLWLPSTETTESTDPASMTNSVAPILSAPLTAQEIGPSNRYSFQGSNTFVTDAGDQIWGYNGTIIRAGTYGSITRVELERGQIVIRARKRHEGAKLLIETSQLEVEVTGTIFAVDGPSDGSPHSVRVIEGSVKVSETGNSAEYALEPNTQYTFGSQTIHSADISELSIDGLLANYHIAVPAPNKNRGTKKATVSQRKPVAPAPVSRQIEPAQPQQKAALLAREARTYRQEKRYALARKTYLTIIDRYTGTTFAAHALVALGQLELTVMNLPSDAATRFETYLRTSPPNGFLREEALLGCVKSHIRTGALGNAINRANIYLRTFPSGMFTERILLQKATAHQRRGECAVARGLLVQIVNDWPHSRQAILAKQKLSALPCRN